MACRLATRLRSLVGLRKETKIVDGLPPGDIYSALEKGAIDAAEWIGSYDKRNWVREGRALLLLSWLVAGLRQWLPLHQQRHVGRASKGLSTNVTPVWRSTPRTTA